MTAAFFFAILWSLAVFVAIPLFLFVFGAISVAAFGSQVQRKGFFDVERNGNTKTVSVKGNAAIVGLGLLLGTAAAGFSLYFAVESWITAISLLVG